MNYIQVFYNNYRLHSILEAQQMIRDLSDLRIVGGDVVEVTPCFDPSGNTALTGASILFEILCVAAHSLHRQRTQE